MARWKRKNFSSSTAVAPPTRRSRSRGLAAARRSPDRWASGDANGDCVLAALAREQVDCAACQRVPGLATALSAIFIDAHGDRTIVTYRDERVAAVIPSRPGRRSPPPPTSCWPTTGIRVFVAADLRGRAAAGPSASCSMPTSATVADDPLLRIATHVVFSSECLMATAGCADLAEGLRAIARHTDSFLAVSHGPHDILFLEGQFTPPRAGICRSAPSIRSAPAMRCTAASRWRSPKDEAKPTALRFAAAVAGIKCTRLGGSAGAPTRAEVDAFMAHTTDKPRAGAARGGLPGLNLEFFSM